MINLDWKSHTQTAEHEAESRLNFFNLLKALDLQMRDREYTVALDFWRISPHSVWKYVHTHSKLNSTQWTMPSVPLPLTRPATPTIDSCFIPSRSSH